MKNNTNEYIICVCSSELVFTIFKTQQGTHDFFSIFLLCPETQNLKKRVHFTTYFITHMTVSACQEQCWSQYEGTVIFNPSRISLLWPRNSCEKQLNPFMQRKHLIWYRNAGWTGEIKNGGEIVLPDLPHWAAVGHYHCWPTTFWPTPKIMRDFADR